MDLDRSSYVGYMRPPRASRSARKGCGMEQMHYRRMDEGTDADFVVLRHVHEQTMRALPDRLFAMLRDLSQDTAYNITRYDHSLQAATRALRDGKDEEYVA